MTTDNRTNEPTPKQVEAAAKAIADCHNPGMFEKYPENWRIEARAALVAAAGVAPQAESYDHCCQHLKCPGGSLCCCVSEQRLRECWNQWREEVNGDRMQAFRDGYLAGQNDTAPAVQQVSESGLADVIETANMEYSLSDRSGESYACGAPDYRSVFIARAVVAALGGEGR